MDARLTMVRSEEGLPEAAFGLPVPEKRMQLLPFTVRAVSNAEELAKAVSIRQRAYGRHVPGLAAQLGRPEPLDLSHGCTVLLAESKLDAEPLGTLRIQTNDFDPLVLESAVALPRHLADARLAEATRLGVSQGRVGHVVRTALFKAFYLYCLQSGVEHMVIGGRAPLDRMYESLLFSDVFPGQGLIPLAYAGNIPHRIMSFEVGSADARWRAAGHPLYDFMVNTHHPDIDIEVVAMPPARLAHSRDALAA